MNLNFVIYLITGLFFLILMIRNFLKEKTKEKICAICLAFTLTWILLWVIRFYLGIFTDNALIGILMGMTILGIFYTLEKSVKKELTLFRLPFLLTLVFAAYYSISFARLQKEFFIVGIIWIVFFIIYLFKENKKLNKLFNKIVDCCKKW